MWIASGCPRSHINLFGFYFQPNKSNGVTHSERDKLEECRSQSVSNEIDLFIEWVMWCIEQSFSTHSFYRHFDRQEMCNLWYTLASSDEHSDLR